MPLPLQRSSKFSFSISKNRCRDLGRPAVQDVFDLRLLVATQRGAENRATVTTELVRHRLGIRSPQKRVDRRVSGLNHRPNLLDELVGDAELILPPRRVESARS